MIRRRGTPADRFDRVAAWAGSAGDRHRHRDAAANNSRTLRPDPARHGATMSEGAGLVLVEREDSLTRRGGRARAELLGVARTRGTYADARAAALTQFGLEPESVSDRFHGLPEGGLKSTLGESHGAWGGIALCAALAYLNHDGSWEGRHHALVHAFGEGDEHFFAALKTVEE